MHVQPGDTQKTIEALYAENEHLKRVVADVEAKNAKIVEQIKHQVKVEQKLHASQRQLDQQIAIYRRFYEFGQQLNASLNLNTLGTIITDFVLYDLNVERCILFLLCQDTNVFRMQAMDGYYDEEERNRICHMTLSLQEHPLAPLLSGAKHIICMHDSTHAEMRSLGHMLGMDEYIILPLQGAHSHPIGLLILGNTHAMAPYQTRIEENEQTYINLSNLVNQVTAAITNAHLYNVLDEERQTLEAKVIQRTQELLVAQNTLQQRYAELDHNTQERERLQAELITMQEAKLRELSTPLIPLSQHTVLLPLIGSIDPQRAQMIVEVLLEGVASYQAEIAIVDITGVPVVDTHVAHALIQAAQAVKLLGGQFILTGIGPSMAQTLVSLGADLSSIVTRGRLQHGIAYALQSR